MLKRIDVVGNPNIGVFVLSTDDIAIVPYGLLDEKADIIFMGGTLGANASSVLDLTGPQPRLLREQAISRADLEKTLARAIK